MSADLNDWFRALLAKHEDRQDALHEAYQALENLGLINRVVVHRYICAKRGCVLATVVRLDGRIVARTRDYKLAPNTNEARSVAVARAKNTLDGNSRWPGHTFDVSELATWGESAGMDMNCRCRLRTVLAADVIRAVGDTTPGHPGAPSRV